MQRSHGRPARAVTCYYNLVKLTSPRDLLITHYKSILKLTLFRLLYVNITLITFNLFLLHFYIVTYYSVLYGVWGDTMCALSTGGWWYLTSGSDRDATKNGIVLSLLSHSYCVDSRTDFSWMVFDIKKFFRNKWILTKWTLKQLPIENSLCL